MAESFIPSLKGFGDILPPFLVFHRLRSRTTCAELNSAKQVGMLSTTYSMMTLIPRFLLTYCPITLKSFNFSGATNRLSVTSATFVPSMIILLRFPLVPITMAAPSNWRTKTSVLLLIISSYANCTSSTSTFRAPILSSTRVWKTFF